MEQMLKRKPVGEASQVFSLACTEILPCLWEKRSTVMCMGLISQKPKAA